MTMTKFFLKKKMIQNISIFEQQERSGAAFLENFLPLQPSPPEII